MILNYISYISHILLHNTDRGVFCATLIAVTIAWWQLQNIKRTSRADFIHRLHKDFFTKKSRDFIQLIDDDELCFDEQADDFHFHKKNDPSNIFGAYEIDDYVIGPLEDIATFEKRGVIEIGMVYEVFSWYIENVWDNCAVHKYIMRQRNEPNCADVYDGLEYIYKKCISYGVAKKHKTPSFLWGFWWWVRHYIDY
jgi:hypothetical protein